MAGESVTTRWWEYYLPRYLMPSIAGAVIVNWLCWYAGDEFRALLLLPAPGKPIDAASLTLLFLYGNLFCYVASYPVLVFHATRVMDFSESEWRHLPGDGYLIAVVLVACAFGFHYVPPEHRYVPAFLTAAVFSAIQLVRFWKTFFPRFAVKGHADPVSPAYYYSYVLAHRRGIPAEETETDEDGTLTKSKNLWRQEIMDTYRHLREHGNSAFIFVLELALAALSYCVVTRPGQSTGHLFGALGLLFAVWAVPSVFVHLLAQYLERRFSRYDLEIRTATKHPRRTVAASRD